MFDQATAITNAAAVHSFDFLVVCGDSCALKSVGDALQQLRGRLNCTGTTATAKYYAARHKVDGIVIDMTLPGAAELIYRVRSGGPNRGSVVFALIASAAETQPAIRAGANFVLRLPLTAEEAVQAFNAAAGSMLSEKRRSSRFPLMVPVELTMNDRRLESTMSNLSESGMAIWSLYYHTPGSAIRFAFEIPFGGVIRGEGEVAWTNADGLAGIRFHNLPDQAFIQLSAWIARRDGNGAN